ncbi:uncharacterized protein LOC116619838 isoform X2 [Nematostella vectensis]|nr:uncharacterized protein LOC116619838 isoform X2 [Nematostella vectensis]
MRLGTLSCQPMVVVFNYVFFSRLEELFCALVYLIRYVLQRTALTYGIAVHGPFIVIFVIRNAMASVSAIIMWSFKTGLYCSLVLIKFVSLSSIHWVTDNFEVITRCTAGVFLACITAVLMFPVLHTFFLYHLFGVFSPGTMISLNSPALVELDTTSQIFVDFSFSVWMILRTIFYYSITRIMDRAPEKPKRTTAILDSSKHVYGISKQWALLATILPCALSTSWPKHMLNNGINLACFALFTNRLNAPRVITKGYTLGYILLIGQSVLVTVHQLFFTATEMDDGMDVLFTMACCGALWVAWRVATDACGRLAEILIGSTFTTHAQGRSWQQFVSR